MARIRSIKPEFFTSEDTTSLSAMARLLYIALWCESDREGRLVWKPKTFKLRYFPADGCDINAMCDEIIALKMVVLYGNGFAYIPTFKDHQHINPREAESSLPEPDASARVRTRQSRDRDTQGGRERKGKSNDASGFVEFWDAYPKKRNRGDAEKAWAKISPATELKSTILQAVEVAKGRDDWRKDGGKFVPYPASWLNARGWEDEDGSGSAKPIWEQP